VEVEDVDGILDLDEPQKLQRRFLSEVVGERGKEGGEETGDMGGEDKGEFLEEEEEPEE